MRQAAALTHTPGSLQILPGHLKAPESVIASDMQDVRLEAMVSCSCNSQYVSTNSSSVALTCYRRQCRHLQSDMHLQAMLASQQDQQFGSETVVRIKANGQELTNTFVHQLHR